MSTTKEVEFGKLWLPRGFYFADLLKAQTFRRGTAHLCFNSSYMEKSCVLQHCKAVTDQSTSFEEWTSYGPLFNIIMMNTIIFPLVAIFFKIFKDSMV